MVCAMIYQLAAIRWRNHASRHAETVFGAVSVSYSDSGPSTPLYPQLIRAVTPVPDRGQMGQANFAVKRA